ncbi:MAG: hypothetical protein ABIO70_24905 [Pseudomonadota bacterium]
MPTPPTALAPILPGEAEIATDLLDQAVAEINRIYVAKGLEMARTLGSYVLATFFGDDLDSFHAREKAHVTFRALGQREDLRVAYTTIWYSVAILGQLRQLPEDIAGALPLSHHKLLLPVHDDKAKLALARKAVREGMSSRELAAAIKKARKGQGTGAGRPALPAFVKGLTRLTKAIELATSEAVDTATFATYSPQKARALVAGLDQQLQTLQALRERVLASAEAFESSTE